MKKWLSTTVCPIHVITTVTYFLLLLTFCISSMKFMLCSIPENGMQMGPECKQIILHHLFCCTLSLAYKIQPTATNLFLCIFLNHIKLPSIYGACIFFNSDQEINDDDYCAQQNGRCKSDRPLPIV